MGISLNEIVHRLRMVRDPMSWHRGRCRCKTVTRGICRRRVPRYFAVPLVRHVPLWRLAAVIRGSPAIAGERAALFRWGPVHRLVADPKSGCQLS